MLLHLFIYFIFYIFHRYFTPSLSQKNRSLSFHQRPLVKATSVRNPAFFLYSTRIKDEGALSLRDLFYSPVLRHSRSIISAQEQNLAVLRRMQSPPRTRLIVRNKEKNNAVPIFPASFIRPDIVGFGCAHSTNKSKTSARVFIILLVSYMKLYSYMKLLTLLTL